MEKLKKSLEHAPIVLCGVGAGFIALAVLFALADGAGLQEAKALVWMGLLAAAAGIVLEEVLK